MVFFDQGDEERDVMPKYKEFMHKLYASKYSHVTTSFTKQDAFMGPIERQLRSRDKDSLYISSEELEIIDKGIENLYKLLRKK